MTACSDDSSLDRLDETIKQRELFLNIKKNRVDSIRHLLTPDIDRQQRLNIYNELFQQYLTFNFDSALMYVDYASDIIEPTDGYELQTQVEIHRALSLATSGHFSHAINILKRIDSTKLPPSLLEEYFSACEWTYGVWAAYSDKRTIAPEFNQMSLAYLDSLIAVTDVSKPEYTYRLAERHLRQHNLKDAKKEYLATLARIPVESRLYAQAAYALASTYRDMQNKEKYKEWMVNAAISDQKVPLKENLALQQLAIFLKEEEGDIKRANYYLELALEDAIFYNNRLRMLEAAEKIPDITTAYQNTINAQNKRLKFYILLIGLLTILLVVVTAYIHRQRKIVSRSKDEMEHLNEKLRELNMQLSQTNKSRQEYVSLFMDLCATYIEKLNRFPIILKLKVKNMGDLNSVADRYVRPTDTETREMFQNFDSAFLRVYPDYIRQFNALLRPDKQIYPRKGELLNTDLRIYALVRMGITDSNKIATLLFLSSQTIFNHRTQVRNRAIDRDNFEKEVANLCEIYP
ncbi:MAG: hypothetical protein HDR79_10540 [Bacteroides sp.]|nr:hypothetical protein [Bacteroides sp.]